MWAGTMGRGEHRAALTASHMHSTQSTKRNLERKAANFKCYTSAIDKNTDATDTAQLATSIRGIANEHNITEEMASLLPLKDITKSIDFYEALNIKVFFFNPCQHIWYSY